MVSSIFLFFKEHFKSIIVSFLFFFFIKVFYLVHIIINSEESFFKLSSQINTYVQIIEAEHLLKLVFININSFSVNIFLFL